MGGAGRSGRHVRRRRRLRASEEVRRRRRGRRSRCLRTREKLLGLNNPVVDKIEPFLRYAVELRLCVREHPLRDALREVEEAFWRHVFAVRNHTVKPLFRLRRAAPWRACGPIPSPGNRRVPGSFPCRQARR